uniref:Class II chitinase 2-2 n=1 Tax=Pseudotsuga menziesii TaxID=3357 RepID=D7P705_PSEMZ|nr:class II chitinase 2-2 [Pseudotsuga menziesii]
MVIHLRVMTASVFVLWLCLALSNCSGDVGYITTEAFFNGILSGAADTCEAKNFYTYSDFITAANAFSGFGTTGNFDDKKREIAAFFANVAHETIGFCYIEEIVKGVYCDSNNTQYPCAAGKEYYGRGPIRLSWNFNYGGAGNYLGCDLLNKPEIVAQNDLIAWMTALWYWNVASDCHSAITSGKGFGATIRAINGAIECNGGNTGEVNDRISYYKKYCTQFGVDPGSNLSC